jgi:hypothetical protein
MNAVGSWSVRPLTESPGVFNHPALPVECHSYTRSTVMYAQYEALARERMREQREFAAHQRMASELASAHLWHRVATYAQHRAQRSDRRRASHAASDYQLAG